MIDFIHRLSMGRKIGAICSLFVLPVGVSLYLIVSGYSQDLNASRLEQTGNAYQRPLMRLLKEIPLHRALSNQYLGNNKSVRGQLSATQERIDRAIEALHRADAQLGPALQFTTEGLAKRKREHYRFETIRSEWEALKRQLDALSPVAADKQHAHLAADVRTMIIHAGDTSGLILDPDLDSYYLMDATLISLPQTADRLAAIKSTGDDVFSRQTMTDSERAQLAVYAALLKESDLERTVADVHYSLIEDQNFYGVSDTLQQNLPAAAKVYTETTEALLALFKKIDVAGTGSISPTEFAAAAAKAHDASFELWNVAVGELDVLLQKRIDHFEQLRLRAVAATVFTLLMSCLFAWFVCKRAIDARFRQLIRHMEVLQNGDFSRPLSLPKGDEFGRLAGSLNTMADKLTALISQVQKSGIQVNGSAREVASATQQQRASAHAVAATTTEIGATSTEIYATSRELVSNVIALTTGAETTARAAGGSRASLARMETTIRHLLDASNVISSKLTVLSEKAGHISAVVTTIAKVADQTNLLSLNAAIEAEKAGEHGRGFSVVATEIRRLADQTAVATHDIEQIVKNMQSAVSAGVMSVDKFSADVRESVQVVCGVSEQLNQIINEVQALTPNIETLKEGMQAQSVGAQQISEALAQLSQSTQETVDTLSQSNTTVEQLNQAARDLHTGVSRFVLQA
jgi:methyl-accepting chemotaxis protein